MGPLLRDASAAFDVATPARDTLPDGAENVGDADDSDDDNDDDGGAVFTAAGGKLRVSTSMHHLYLHRCLPDDTEHPCHGMSYVVWMRLVRIEKSAPLKDPTPPDPEDDDSEPEGESIDDCCSTSPAKAPAKKRGRRPAGRYGFVGLPRVKKQQVRNLISMQQHVPPLQ